MTLFFCNASLRTSAIWFCLETGDALVDFLIGKDIHVHAMSWCVPLFLHCIRKQKSAGQVFMVGLVAGERLPKNKRENGRRGMGRRHHEGSGIKLAWREEGNRCVASLTCGRMGCARQR